MTAPAELVTGDRELKALTSLRFRAALWVFVFHIHIRWPLPLSSWMKGIVMQGALGVSLFFVLSGFILTWTYSRVLPFDTGEMRRRYAVRRFARIAPTYYVGAALSLPWLVRTAQDGGVVFAALIGVANAVVLNPWVPPIAMSWFGTGGWSIGVEAFFYAVFPFLGGWLVRQRLRVVYGLALLSWVGLFFPALLLFLGLRFELAYAFPPSRVAEFVWGACLAQLLMAGRLRWSRAAVPAVVLVAIMYLAAFGADGAEHVQHHPFMVPAFGLIIVGLAQSERGLMHSKGPQILGHASYSFYVTQIPLLFLLSSVDRRTGLVSGLSSVLLLIVATLVNSLLALSIWRLVEQPMRGRLVRLLETRFVRQRPGEVSA